MVCEYYYFCADHKCSLSGRYGNTISNSQYSNYCRYNGYGCDILKGNKNKTNSNTNNPNNKNNNSGCFITTIVCNILGKEDNDYLLEDLRWFRDNVLQEDKNGMYDDILKSYDIIGPVLSYCLINDKDSDRLALFLYNDVLIPINGLIKKKEYELASERYLLMVLGLINYYGLKHPYNDIADKNYGYKENEFDRKMAGHGKRKILVNNTK